jgi:hypothetical protein
MSDFSELCPLFNTGVYNEVSFGTLKFTNCSTTNNAFNGALTAAAHPGVFKFQRTVIVTKVYAQKQGAAGTAVVLTAGRRAGTGTAAKTVFASCAWTSTDTKYMAGRMLSFTQASAKTFLAADVLDFGTKTSVTDPGKYCVIVRYKEK